MGRTAIEPDLLRQSKYHTTPEIAQLHHTSSEQYSAFSVWNQLSVLGTPERDKEPIPERRFDERSSFTPTFVKVLPKSRMICGYSRIPASFFLYRRNLPAVLAAEDSDR
jgi:hypothetical protein